jgi:acyl-CoA synthetase (AMP-forming)/AMP-acid ligase II
MNIASLLAAVADPDRPALILADGGSAPVSFLELDDLSSRLAEGFWCNGLRAEERVVILTPISLYLYASLIALFKLGATAVFLDPQTGYAALNRTAALIDARALICTSKVSWLRMLVPSLRRIPRTFVSDGSGPDSLHQLARTYSPRRSTADTRDDLPALITFTGGTTDPSGPRGVLRTHGLLNAQHLALSQALSVQPGDVDMPAFPVVTLHNLAAGITSVMPDFPFRRPDAVQPEKVLSQIAAHSVTTASGPPAYWGAIAGYCMQHGHPLSLRRIVTGGAVASRALILQLTTVAPSAEILIVYGSTEAEPVSVISAAEFLAEEGLPISNETGVPLGKPVSDIDVRIRDGSGPDRSAGQVGEIWVSGPHVARGYFANPRAESFNKRIEADGRAWHRMGDLGYRDSAGGLWLSGRVNTTVVREGRPLYPAPIESLAATLPFIYRAALFGVPDALLGERSVLAVEFAENVPLPADWRSQLTALCAARGWILDEVYSMRHLPVDRRHNSRMDYARLKSARLHG